MRFKTLFSIVILLGGMLGVMTLAGCSAEQLSAFAADHPKLAPTTQTVGRVEIAIDKGADVATTGGNILTSAGNAGSALGIPYSASLSGAGLVILGLVGMWRKARGDANTATSGAAAIVTTSHNEGTPGLTPAMQSTITTIAAFDPTLAAKIKQALPAASTS